MSAPWAALARWRAEILAHHATGASIGPTEGLNLLIKKVKRVGHGHRRFANYRLRLLLHCRNARHPTARMARLDPRTIEKSGLTKLVQRGARTARATSKGVL